MVVRRKPGLPGGAAVGGPTIVRQVAASQDRAGTIRACTPVVRSVVSQGRTGARGQLFADRLREGLKLGA
ncbi:hypothetical protein GCM10022419_120110 [Nonomuraea rosea]|uniref:Uncharacterized protein n=1 Tax=Nonomuraea rosea TaxID=638574 RepID=A0ABP6ZR23_9ACTN